MNCGCLRRACRDRHDDDGAMSVVESSDPHAHAFLGVRIGGYDLARNDAELARLSRAVAPSGRTTAGMAYSVTRGVDLMMTRGHRGPTPESQSASTLRTSLVILTSEGTTLGERDSDSRRVVV